MIKNTLLIVCLNFKLLASFDSNLNLQITYWEQEPPGIPQGRLIKRYQLHLDSQVELGSFRVYNVPLPSAGGITAKLSIFTIVPQDSKPSYFQIKLQVMEPFYILCAQSVEWKYNSDFPPLICAGRENLDHNILGMTIVSNSKTYDAKSR